MKYHGFRPPSPPHFKKSQVFWEMSWDLEVKSYQNQIFFSVESRARVFGLRVAHLTITVNAPAGKNVGGTLVSEVNNLALGPANTARTPTIESCLMKIGNMFSLVCLCFFSMFVCGFFQFEFFLFVIFVYIEKPSLGAVYFLGVGAPVTNQNFPQGHTHGLTMS